MPDLLLELFSEEIPARMQRKAAGDLRKLVTDALVDAGLTYEGARDYWTPRRLTLDVRGLAARSADLKEERKGPRTDAPEQAVAGFLRGAGLSSADEAEVRSDPKKGDFYVAVINKPGRSAEEIIADVMPGIIQNFPWPKSMRWGEKSAEAGSLKWVRPLQSILCTFGPETEEPEVVKFEVGGVESGNTTRGHRFHAPGEIIVRRFDDYVSALEKAHVVLDAERRKEIIKADAKNLAFASGLDLVEDEGLLEEVGNLVEWPVALLGEFEADYLDIPPEVIRLTIKENQKCFVLRKGEGLSNNFLMVANIEASDGGVEIVKGNAKVVNARLADAKFFWESDLHQIASDEGFTPWLDKLDNVTFHAKLGSQGEWVKRIAKWAEKLAPVVGADPKLAKRAAEIAKADLNSAMVYEFPEMQGLMGRRYAERAGEDASVALAIEEHYKPQGPSDDVPSDPVSVTAALADKLFTLAGFWSIDEKPTGSRDPYALRRAALGTIRLMLENKAPLALTSTLNEMIGEVLLQNLGYNLEKASMRMDELALKSKKYVSQIESVEIDWTGDSWPFSNSYSDGIQQIAELKVEGKYELKEDFDWATKFNSDLAKVQKETPFITKGLLSFFHDRLKVYLRDSGARHDLIDAVITPQSDDLLAISRRVEALGAFLGTDDGANLLAGTKRAVNILAAEEKKGTSIAGSVDAGLFETDEERALFDSLEEVERFSRDAIKAEKYEMALSALARLRAPVDMFFEHVMVNADDEKIRANRLALMRRIRDATGTVADFSKIAG